MSHNSLFDADARTIKRNKTEKRFRAYGLAAISIGLMMLAMLLFTIISKGTSAFQQSFITLDVVLDQAEIDDAEKALMKTSKYKVILSKNLVTTLEAKGITVDLTEKEQGALISKRASDQLRQFVLANQDKVGHTVQTRVLASSQIDAYMKGRLSRDTIANNKYITPEQLDLADQLIDGDILQKRFNLDFIKGADASENSPEAAGFGSAILGSLAMMIVVLALSLPIGVAASIYLEEFAPKNKLTDLIEVNISNLAAVPSIVYGILGLALFLNYLGPLSANDWLRNNSPFVGALVLALMTLPRIVIPTRAALKAVPPSIRDAALGIGASKMQTIFHHVLPLAMPGILTGTIIGLAQALGESAPLLLIGLVGFIGGELPTTMDQFFGGPNTVMPAQIYQWASRADPAFYERAWGGIIILLVFLITMNAIAIILRSRFERRW